MSENNGSELTPLNVRIPVEMKQALKVRAAQEHCGLDVYVRAVLDGFLLATSEKPPSLASISTVFKS